MPYPLGSLRLGLVSMIPNLLPIALALGLMGALAMPLDTFTLLIGSIALGLVVDDTIHFMHNYRRYLEQTGDSREAIPTPWIPRAAPCCSPPSCSRRVS